MAPAMRSATGLSAATPHVVATLGRSVADGLLAGGVLPVIKHIPGQGRATGDSHIDAAGVDADLATLARYRLRAVRANSPICRWR